MSTVRRALGFVFAVTLLLAALWTSAVRDVLPQAVGLLLLGVGLAIGARALKRPQASPFQ